MKSSFFIVFFLVHFSLYAQKPCDLSANITDSIGSYKATKDYLVYERNFAGTSAYAFFSLVLTDELPTLNIQFITKSERFIKANCLDKNSKIYLQLNNGKIVTLFHIDEESCGTSVRDDKGLNNRVMTGYFMFMKDSFEDLKSSPVSVMRVKYATESIDYIFKSELISEMDSKTYVPENYFIETLHCIMD